MFLFIGGQFARCDEDTLIRVCKISDWGNMLCLFC